MANDISQSKKHLNIGTIGHVDHGKTTLMAAISKYCSDQYAGNKAVPFDKIDKSPEEKQRGITITSTTIEFETDKGHYSATDCPGHKDYIKNMITGATGSDVLILVVAGDEGAMKQTHEHILLAKQINVPNLVVFINKADVTSDEDLLILVEEEMRDLAKKHGFKDVKIFIGSALGALNGDEKYVKVIGELMHTLDSFPSSERAVDKPFLLAVESVYSIEGRGTVVAGKIIRGIINVGDQVDVVRQKKETAKGTVTGVEMFKKSYKKAEAGHNVGLLLRGFAKNEVSRGDILAAPGSVKANTKFTAEAYILTPEEGGRKGKIKPNYRPQFFIRTADITGKVNAVYAQEEGKLVSKDFVMPGDQVTMEIDLVNQVALEESLRIAIREGGQTIAAAVITKVGEFKK